MKSVCQIPSITRGTMPWNRPLTPCMAGKTSLCQVQGECQGLDKDARNEAHASLSACSAPPATHSLGIPYILEDYDNQGCAPAP